MVVLRALSLNPLMCAAMLQETGRSWVWSTARVMIAEGLRLVFGLFARLVPVGTLTLRADAGRAAQVAWSPFMATAQTAVTADAHQITHQRELYTQWYIPANNIFELTTLFLIVIYY